MPKERLLRPLEKRLAPLPHLLDSNLVVPYLFDFGIDLQLHDAYF